MALWPITKHVSVLRERLSRWTEAKSEHGLSKDPTVPTRVLKKTNTKPRTPKVSFGASRDVSGVAGEGLGRGWEEREEREEAGGTGGGGRNGRRNSGELAGRLPEKPARGGGEGWWVGKWSFR